MNPGRGQGKRLLRRFIPVGLALPLVAFVLVTFVIPLATMVVQSVHDPEVADAFPQTLALLVDWEDSALPFAGCL